MQIEKTKIPDVIVIRDFFDGEDLRLIKEELRYLDNKLKGPQSTGSATDDDGSFMKNNEGLFLNNFFNSSDIVNNSSIVKAFEKIYNEPVLGDLIKESIVYRYLIRPHRIHTLVSKYVNGSYYKNHTDDGVLTVLGYVITDQEYEGGDLFFSDFGETVKIYNNTLLLMPSYLNHEVVEIKSKTNEFVRYSISQFIFLIGG